MDNEDDTTLTAKQISQGIEKYGINPEGADIVSRLLKKDFPITDIMLKNISKHYYMTEEILSQKIKEYRLSKKSIHILYDCIADGLHLSEITDDLLERLGKYGKDGAPEIVFFKQSINPKRDLVKNTETLE